MQVWGVAAVARDAETRNMSWDKLKYLAIARYVVLSSALANTHDFNHRRNCSEGMTILATEECVEFHPPAFPPLCLIPPTVLPYSISPPSLF